MTPTPPRRGRPPGPRPPAPTPAAALVASALTAAPAPTLTALARVLLAAGWQGAAERSLLCALSRTWAGRRDLSPLLAAWLRAVAERGPAFRGAADVAPPDPPSPALLAAAAAGVHPRTYRARRRRGETHEQALDPAYPRPRGADTRPRRGVQRPPVTEDGRLIAAALAAAGAPSLTALAAVLLARGLTGPGGAVPARASVVEQLSRARRRGGARLPEAWREALRRI